MIITTDDLCLSYLENFKYFDEIKKDIPDFRIIAFTIGNFNDEELLVESNIFKTWFEKHKDWVEIAVHSYDHKFPPDGDRDDEEFWIKKGLESLKSYLPSEYGYRSPGWQTTNKTEGILKKLGFSYIAYESHIKYLNKEMITTERILNSHLYDLQSIELIEKEVRNK